MKGKVRAALGLLLGGVFVYAGIVKVAAPVEFFTDLQNYDLLPWRPIAVALAFYLPCLEIVCGVAVAFRRFRTEALLFLTAMLVIFIGALAIAWARGLNVSCGCFGGESAHPRYLLWIGRDLVLLGVTGFLIFSERGDRGALGKRP